jgi:hypothetical protein
MITTDLLALIYGADRKFSYEEFRTWVVSQSVRNALETFHGGWAFDPDNPGSGEGFISDNQMRVLNITIRRAVHEALGQVDLACDGVKRLQRLGLFTEDDPLLLGAAGLARAGADVPAVRQRAGRQPVTCRPHTPCQGATSPAANSNFAGRYGPHRCSSD